MKHRAILPVVAIALVALLAAGATTVYAADTGSQRQTIVHTLARHFNLNEGEVAHVFDETLAEHQAEMQTRFEARLTQAVTDGKLTAHQKDLILAKEAELKAVREADRAQFKAMTPAARRAAIRAKRQELQAWAQANGIDLHYLLGGLPKGRPGRRLATSS